MKVHRSLLFVLPLLAACQGPAPDSTALSEPPVVAPEPTAAAPSAVTDTAEAADPGSPTLVVTTLDGASFDLAARRGKWVVVNFWATWCAPCLKEIPDLTAFDAAREDVEVIGLAYEEITPDDMRAFLKQHPASPSDIVPGRWVNRAKTAVRRRPQPSE